MIDPVEAKEKFPLIDKNAFQAAMYCPADGTIDPAMLVNALKKLAEKNGCKVFLSIFFIAIICFYNTHIYIIKLILYFTTNSIVSN